MSLRRPPTTWSDLACVPSEIHPIATKSLLTGDYVADGRDKARISGCGEPTIHSWMSHHCSSNFN